MHYDLHLIPTVRWVVFDPPPPPTGATIPAHTPASVSAPFVAFLVFQFLKQGAVAKCLSVNYAKPNNG